MRHNEILQRVIVMGSDYQLHTLQQGNLTRMRSTQTEGASQGPGEMFQQERKSSTKEIMILD